MANLKLRFSIYTQDINQDISAIAKQLPTSNRESVCLMGDYDKKSINKESAIDYVYNFDKIHSLDDVNLFFLEEWAAYSLMLKELINSSYKAYLLFEFDMDNYEVFPEMVYNRVFINFLASIGIELQLYFYPK